jgi:hypothetical protein
VPGRLAGCIAEGACARCHHKVSVPPSVRIGGLVGRRLSPGITGRVNDERHSLDVFVGAPGKCLGGFYGNFFETMGR